MLRTVSWTLHLLLCISDFPWADSMHYNLSLQGDLFVCQILRQKWALIQTSVLLLHSLYTEIAYDEDTSCYQGCFCDPDILTHNSVNTGVFLLCGVQFEEKPYKMGSAVDLEMGQDTGYREWKVNRGKQMGRFPLFMNNAGKNSRLVHSYFHTWIS